MPMKFYGRRGSRGPRFVRKRTFKRNYMNRFSSVRRFTRINRRVFSRPMIMAQPKPELKYVDVAASGTAFPAVNTTTIVLLNGLSLGTTSTTRIGQRITLSKISYRFYVSSPSATGGLDQAVRILVIYDRQANALTPAATDIFAQNPLIVSPLNISNSRRFLVLTDLFKAIPFYGDSNWFYNRTITFPFGDNLTEYNILNNGDIRDITTGAVYLVFCTDNVVVGQYPLITYYSRIRYFDS